MAKKKVLIIAYYFPPLGGAGVQRSAKFVKFLARKGWDISVLTVQEDKHFVRDKKLFKDIPLNLKIYRSKCFPLESFLNIWTKIKMGFLSPLFFKCLIPDPQIGWLIPSFLLAKKIIREENIDILYTTSHPFTAHFIGFLLKRQIKKIKWVTDFRDPWSQNVILYNMLGKARQKIDAVFEKRILNQCDHIITVTKSCRTNLIKKFKLDLDKVSVITNGYDEDDFSFPRENIETRGDNFQILYNGSAYSEYNPNHFVDAMVKHVLPFNSNIRLVFAGESAEWVKNYLLRKNWYEKFHPFFRFTGYVNHDVSVQLVLDSHLLLLPIPNSIPYNMTGKIFEYMRSGVPILATVPVQGDAADVIRTTKTGVVVDPDHIEEIGHTVNDLYAKWKEQKLNIHPDSYEINKFQRSALTDQLIHVFHKVGNEN